MPTIAQQITDALWRKEFQKLQKKHLADYDRLYDESVILIGGIPDPAARDRERAALDQLAANTETKIGTIAGRAPSIASAVLAANELRALGKSVTPEITRLRDRIRSQATVVATPAGVAVAYGDGFFTPRNLAIGGAVTVALGIVATLLRTRSS